MGELHLEVLVDRMMREFNVDATVGKPQVAYRETITAGREGPLHATRSRRVARASSPTSRSTWSPPARRGYEFDDKISGGRIPQGVHPRSTRASRRPVVGRARRLPDGRRQGHLVDGSYHDVDSSEMAFKIAGTMAFKEAARKAKPVSSSRSWPSRS
jgi:elongation factor G